MKKLNIFLALSAMIVSLSFMSNEKSSQENNIAEVGAACIYKAATSESPGAAGAWTAGGSIGIGTAVECGVTAVSSCNPVGWAIGAGIFLA